MKDEQIPCNRNANFFNATILMQKFHRKHLQCKVFSMQNELNARKLTAIFFKCKTFTMHKTFWMQTFWMQTILNANLLECNLFWMQTILIANHFKCKSLHIVCMERFRRWKKAMYIWGICKGQSVINYFLSPILAFGTF